MEDSWQSIYDADDFLSPACESEAKKLNILNDDDFLVYIIMNAVPDQMNNVVSDEKFKAYDIAVQCYKHKHLSVKQRLAISNTYCYSKYNQRFDKYVNGDD